MHRGIPGWLVLAASLFVPPGAVRAQESGTRLTPPDPVGAFRLQSVEEMQGDAGHLLRYRHPDGGTLDVYLYGFGRESCAASCDSVAVDAEAGGFASLIPQLLQRGNFDALAVDADQPVKVPTPAGEVYGRHLTMSGRTDGDSVESHMYLFAMREYIAKVRATFPPSRAHAELVGGFARAFVTQLDSERARQVACRQGPADEGGIQITVDFKGRSTRSTEKIGARVRTVLDSLGYRLDPAVAGSREWRTLPRFSWPVEDPELWAGSEHPGLVVGVKLQEGDSPRLLVNTRALCRVPTVKKDEDIGAMLELFSAALIAGALEGALDP